MQCIPVRKKKNAVMGLSIVFLASLHPFQIIILFFPCFCDLLEIKAVIFYTILKFSPWTVCSFVSPKEVTIPKILERKLS